MLVEYAAVENMVQLEAMDLADGSIQQTIEDLRSLARQEERYRDEKGWRSVYRAEASDPSGRAAFWTRPVC